MARLGRAESRERNRRRVLAAARAVFAERGFREARIDEIAERAELTRGAVYSNFPGKRALYFTVLAELAELAADAQGQPVTQTSGRWAEAGGPGAALREFARAWLAGLPLATEGEPPRLTMDLLGEVQADEGARRAYAQLMSMNAALLGLALERSAAGGGRAVAERRMVRVAEAVLTVLRGATQLSAAAPGFVEPFDTIAACERLAGLELEDVWAPPHLPFVPPAVAEERAWTPQAALDALSGDPVRLDGDGVLAVLGVRRLSAVEEAVRALPAGQVVTAIVVSEEPAELLPLARLAIAEFGGCLRRAVPSFARPPVRVVFDESGALAAAAGGAEPDDLTETALRVSGGRVIASAHGHGAGHAAGSWPAG